MKRITLLLLCTLALLTGKSYAQEKGEMFIGGDLALGVTAYSYYGTEVGANFSIAPEFAYFLVDNLRVGGNLNYTYDSSHSITINPSVAYYARLAHNFYYVPEFTIGIGGAWNSYMDSFVFQLGLEIFAVEFRPTKHFAMSVNMLSLEYANLSGINGFGFTLGGKSSVGLRYYF